MQCAVRSAHLELGTQPGAPVFQVQLRLLQVVRRGAGRWRWQRGRRWCHLGRGRGRRQPAVRRRWRREPRGHVLQVRVCQMPAQRHARASDNASFFSIFSGAARMATGHATARRAAAAAVAPRGVVMRAAAVAAAVARVAAPEGATCAERAAIGRATVRARAAAAAGATRPTELSLGLALASESLLPAPRACTAK